MLFRTFAVKRGDCSHIRLTAWHQNYRSRMLQPSATKGSRCHNCAHRASCARAPRRSHTTMRRARAPDTQQSHARHARCARAPRAPRRSHTTMRRARAPDTQHTPAALAAPAFSHYNAPRARAHRTPVGLAGLASLSDTGGPRRPRQSLRHRWSRCARAMIWAKSHRQSRARSSPWPVSDACPSRAAAGEPDRETYSQESDAGVRPGHRRCSGRRLREGCEDCRHRRWRASQASAPRFR